ncbi:MAG: hybrid sensor histidine kinase/response regulator [Bacteriovoracaceae bacterium]|nr:hybrid sensor histidine kinase/response regulator [Bacteriovoracaceae bacterium]
MVRPNYDKMSLTEIFQLDSKERIATLNKKLLILEKGPSQEIFNDAMREAHSLKAAARVVGCQEVQALSHKIEDLLETIKNTKQAVTQSQADLIFKAFDALEQTAKAFVSSTAHSIDVESITKLLDDAKTPSTLTDNVPSSNNINEQKPPKTDVDTMPTVHQTGDIKEIGQSTIRIDIDKLDRLMNLSGELYTRSLYLEQKYSSSKVLLKQLRTLQTRTGELRVLATNPNINVDLIHNWLSQNDNELQKMQQNIQVYTRSLQQTILDFSHLTTQLQDEVMQSRMLPISTLFDYQHRVVRDLSRELSKNITLKVQGGSTPVDREILEVLKDPLAHLIRNACDHGIEDPRARAREKKAQEGTIKLISYYQGDRVIVVVEDDGKGIPLDQLREIALEKGIAKKEEINRYSYQQVLDWVFLPGFSTSQSVSTLSGRGIGLDVVGSNLKKIGGNIKVETKRNEHTRFILSLPLTLSVVKCLLVEVAKEFFCFPLTRIESTNTIKRKEIKTIEGQSSVSIRGEIMAVVDLNDFWQMDKLRPSGNEQNLPVVVIGERHERFAFIVDRFLGEKEIVVKTLGKRANKVAEVSGGTMLENKKVAFIIDTEKLTNAAKNYATKDQTSTLSEIITTTKKKILVVEDTLTVRELERKTLERHGYDVKTAVDGLEGLGLLKQESFDLVITDIEMPRMDGIEMVRCMKKEPKLNNIPTVIISYKESDEDKRKGLEVGADRYISKGKYETKVLIEAIHKLLGA